MSEKKGLFLVLGTALVSGISIFLNSFAVQGFNPFAFTFLKNAAVALFLFALIVLLKEFTEIRKLSLRQWKQLAAIGLVGGSAPFLLFFYALKLSSPATAGLLHKTLFIWATMLAFIFLREKISKQFIAAALLLFAGSFIISGTGSFGLPEFLILAATLLWSAENILAKHVLQELNGTILAFGRMFFGSAFILVFLALTNQLQYAVQLSMPQMQWVLLASSLLFLYVFTYYNGLKHIAVHKATALLLLAQPITAILSFAFLGKTVSFAEAFGLTLIVAGAMLAMGFGYVLNSVKRKVVLVARN